MRIALITTSIEMPTVLRLYRKLGPEVEFFIAGDLKSPHDAIQKLCAELGNAHYLPPSDQQKWKCSELIGWNNIQRRNIALLEAMRWGADVIYTCDTDDLPLHHDHFEIIWRLLFGPYDGVEMRSKTSWVDPGWLVHPPVSHRGMPVRLDRVYGRPTVSRKVGVVASTVLGSCDLPAVDRIVGTAQRHSKSVLADSGVIVDPSISNTVFNSEAVAFDARMAPAMMVLPGVGRFDDLFASLITQRVMRELGEVVHFGRPLVWHERADRDYLKDLENEMLGMRHIEEFAAHLDSVVFPPSFSVLQMVTLLLDSLDLLSWLPANTAALGDAWVADCAEALRG